MDGYERGDLAYRPQFRPRPGFDQAVQAGRYLAWTGHYPAWFEATWWVARQVACLAVWAPGRIRAASEGGHRT